jgi:hypothetical protein
MMHCIALVALIVNIAFITPVAVAQQIAIAEPPAGAKVVSAPNVKPGSYWVLVNQDADIRVELTKVRDGVFITKFGKDERKYTNEWNALDGPGAKTGTWVTYNPNLTTLSFPLYEGKKWTQTVRWSSGSFSDSFVATGEVKGWERIKVPAGEFEALRVENMNGPNSSTCWYAPEAERFVKCTSSNPRFAFEVKEYKIVQ